LDFLLGLNPTLMLTQRRPSVIAARLLASEASRQYNEVGPIKIEFERRAMAASLKRRVLRAGGWSLAKRLIKPIPVVGSAFALSLAGYEIKKKGLLPGAIHVGLDVTPLIGTAKGVVEIFTGDLIPDRDKRRRKR
jgi:hypothetical protein